MVLIPFRLVVAGIAPRRVGWLECEPFVPVVVLALDSDESSFKENLKRSWLWGTPDGWNPCSSCVAVPVIFSVSPEHSSVSVNGLGGNHVWLVVIANVLKNF
jgi:hypothetical protein